jgi:high frequency lysogenization protein
VAELSLQENKGRQTVSESIITDRVLALSGLVQAVKLVKQVATKGYAQETELKTCLFSIMQTEVQDVEQVYGEIKNLRFGLQELKIILDVKQKNKDSDIVRYLLSVLHLEKQLSKHSEMLTIIQTGISNVKTQLINSELTSQDIITTLANIYQQSMSPAMLYI